MRDRTSEFVTVARALVQDPPSRLNSLGDVYGEPIEGGRPYAVVDEEGYVGTLRVSEQKRDILAHEPFCRATPEWWASWIDPPSRPVRKDTTWALGPVNGRFASARRLLPLSQPPDAPGSEKWPYPHWPETANWTTQFQFAFDSDPRALEVRARRCTPGTIVTEARVLQDGHYRVVGRTLRSSCQGAD